MPKYLIEREMPGFGSQFASLSSAEAREGLLRNREILQGMGPQIQWLHSYISGDKVYCVYYAANEELIREHARRVGAPADVISEITSVVDWSSIDA